MQTERVSAFMVSKFLASAGGVVVPVKKFLSPCNLVGVFHSARACMRFQTFAAGGTCILWWWAWLAPL